MNQAALYVLANSLQRSGTKNFCEEFAKLIQWRENGCDSLIDIGSGTGDVLMDNIYPLLPHNFQELVFSDISEEMVKYAKKCYASCERTKFIVLDIVSDVIPHHLCDHFDHVTSFYSLHWIHNQLKALQNIYKLLRPGSGDCLQLVVASHFIFDCFEILAKDTKWSSYIQDYKRFISPLHHCVNPAVKFEQCLSQAGFVDCKVENRVVEYTCENRLDFFNFLKTIGVLFERIAEEQQEELFEDFVGILKSMNLCRFIENSEDYKVVTTYTLVMAYARKPGLSKNGTSHMSDHCIQEEDKDVGR